MKNAFFPSDLVEYSAEAVLTRDPAKGHIIYRTIVLSLFIAIILLPILKVSVSVQSNGIIRPVTDKNEIKALVSGKVSSIPAQDNQKIAKDQILLKIDTSVIDEKLNLISYELNEQNLKLSDLLLITKSQSNLSVPIDMFKTTHYKSEYLLLKNRIKDNTFRQINAQKELTRYQGLVGNNFVSVSNLETKELELSSMKIELELLNAEHMGRWNKELLASQMKLKQLHAEEEQLKQEKDLFTIGSPIAGTLEQFTGISTGSYVQAGQKLGAVSPDDGMQVEVYVSPQDIGLIKVGTKARVQVDAFNYNQWGLISGQVLEISEDFLPIEDQPFFKVKCQLDQNHLTLKNGYKGYLKKGMTVRTRFIITDRSLFQLLYDKVDDWLNPLQISV